MDHILGMHMDYSSNTDCRLQVASTYPSIEEELNAPTDYVVVAVGRE